MAALDPGAWDRLICSTQPFVGHAFLNELEQSACVSAASGWSPRHLLLRDQCSELVGALPLYLKDHSWGEFVFDFSWAQAYAEHGLDYYPKLVGMCPFTPVTGERLLAAGRHPALLAALARAAIDEAQARRVSSLHILFTQPDELAALSAAGFLPRKDCRFIWYNRGYADFGRFLAALRSARRKQVRRERRRVAEQGIEVRTEVAQRLDTPTWRTVHALTSRTFLQRGHQPYLSLSFLRAAATHLGERMLINLARQHDRVVGAAILFRDREALYGRYWGAAAEFDCLHFETCYYRGIEYCIEHGLQRFDPGTQGEHKVRRGFAPSPTWSAHWIAHTGFRRAIASYLHAERADVDTYMEQAAAHLPYREQP